MSYTEISTAFQSLQAPITDLSRLYQQSNDRISAAATVDPRGAVTIDENALRAAIADIVPPGSSGQYELLTSGLDTGFIVDRDLPVAPWSALTTPEVFTQFDAPMWNYLGFGQEPTLTLGAPNRPMLLRTPLRPFAALRQWVPPAVTSPENMAMLATAATQSSAQSAVSSRHVLDGSIWMLNPDNAATVIVKQPQAGDDPNDLGTTSSGQALSADDFKDLPGCLQQVTVGWDNPFILRLCFGQSCAATLGKALNAIISEVTSGNGGKAITALLTTGVTAAVGALGGWVSACIALSAAYWALMIWACTTPNGVCLHIPMPWTFGVIGPGWATGR